MQSTQNPKFVNRMKITFIKQSLLLAVFVIITMSFTFPKFDVGKPSNKVYKGYIITSKGDTLHGKLQMLSPTQNQVKVKFINKNGKREIYKAKAIKSYAFQAQVWDKSKKSNIQKWIYYTKKTVERPPIPFGGNDILMQQEIKGTINVYNYYIETRSNQNMEHIVYIEKSNVLYDVNRDNYKKILKPLMADYSIVYNKIGKKGYTYKFLNQTIMEYNQESSKKGEATISYDMK